MGLGVADEAADLYLFKLVPQLSGNQELTFPPMDIPQHVLIITRIQAIEMHKSQLRSFRNTHLRFRPLQTANASCDIYLFLLFRNHRCCFERLTNGQNRQ